MTDKIIKALECCTYTSDCDMRCSECPFSNSLNCRALLARNTLALINRQRAKIEALQMDNEQLQSDIANANMNAEHALAEIDRLNRDLDLVVRNTIEVTKTAMQLARDKAIKEFAERLKANTIEFGAAKGIQREVDRLVKEMVGEDK